MFYQLAKQIVTKVRSSYGPLAYFSDNFISGKNVVFSAQEIFNDHSIRRIGRIQCVLYFFSQNIGGHSKADIQNTGRLCQNLTNELILCLFLWNYYCNTRTFATLNSFSEKVLNWLDLKTSPFSLWFVLEKIAFKGFERNKKEGWGGKKAHWFFFALFGGMKEGDLMEWKSLQNTQQSFLFCLQEKIKGFRAWTNI